MSPFALLLPEVVLAALACLMFLGGTFRVPGRSWPWLALAALAFSGAALCGLPAFPPADVLNPSAVIHDPLSVGFRASCLVVAALFVLASWKAQVEGDSPGEFYALLLLVVAGTMLVSAANDLVLMILALELNWKNSL